MFLEIFYFLKTEQASKVAWYTIVTQGYMKIVYLSVFKNI